MATLRLGKFKFIFKMSKPKTVWWHLIKKDKDKPLQRVDSLIALERAFIRRRRVYVYSLKIGRLKIMMADTMQNHYYVPKELTPILNGFLAYRSKEDKDGNIVGYYGVSKKFGYKKLIGKLFVRSKNYLSY